MNSIADILNAEKPGSLQAGLAARRSFQRQMLVVWLILAALAVLGLIILGFVYRRFLLSGLDIIAGETGSRTTALLAVAFCVFIFVCVLCWLLLPVIVYLGLRDLRRRAAELDLTAQLCAQQLARLADRSHEPPTTRWPKSE